MAPLAATRNAARKGLREEHKLLTRGRILEAARDAFEALGYAATTVDEIAARAGVGRATFYLHFATKQEVFANLAVENFPTFREFYRRLDSLIGADSHEQVRAWMDEVVSWLEEHRSTLLLSMEIVYTDRDLAAGHARRTFALVLESMPRYLAAWPPSRREEARLRVVLLLAQIERFFQHWVLFGSWEGSRDLVVDVLSEVWFRTLQPPRDDRK
jgi:AcrR family transcriptional regulator